jgi:hypothetical protein
MIYRGVVASGRRHAIRRLRRMPWTLDASRADAFARAWGRPGFSGFVGAASIRRKDILAYFGSRSEAEVIVNPNGLRDLTICEAMDAQAA